MVADVADMTSTCNCKRFQMEGGGGGREEGLMLLTRQAQATAVDVFKQQSARGPRSKIGHGNTPHHTTLLSTKHTITTHTTHLQTESKCAQDFAEEGGELEADRHTSLAADSCVVSSPGGAVSNGAQ